MNTETAADYAKVTTATMRKWCRTGKIPATKTSGQWHINQDALEQALSPLSNDEHTL